MIRSFFSEVELFRTPISQGYSVCKSNGFRSCLFQCMWCARQWQSKSIIAWIDRHVGVNSSDVSWILMNLQYIWSIANFLGLFLRSPWFLFHCGRGVCFASFLYLKISWSDDVCRCAAAFVQSRQTYTGSVVSLAQIMLSVRVSCGRLHGCAQSNWREWSALVLCRVTGQREASKLFCR